MKKIISIVLALVMMMAVTIPAFATRTAGEGDNNVPVETTYNETTDASYTVTIPATISIPWNNTTPQDAKYRVESQLLIGAKLKVSASANNGGTMTATGTDDTLTFTVTGGDVVEFIGVNAKDTTSPDGTINGENVKVLIADFTGKAVGVYTGTITYTVEYSAS